MTMRMMGVQGELTGPCVEVGEDRFLMDVEGESFQAEVFCSQKLLRHAKVGRTLFVVGRIHFKAFDQGKLLVDAQKIHAIREGAAELKPDPLSPDELMAATAETLPPERPRVTEDSALIEAAAKSAREESD